MLSFFKKKAAKSEEAANGKTMKAYLTGKVIPIEGSKTMVFSQQRSWVTVLRSSRKTKF